MKVLGLDIGGTGIKGAIVDTATGEMLTERERLDTPHPATVAACGETISKVVKTLEWEGIIGCGFPAIIKNGVAKSAGNISQEWIDTSVEGLVEQVTGCKNVVLNDADAAGLAELKFGAGKDVKGTVIVVTLGTGIGTAIFIDGKLLPNTEFGQVRFRGDKAEKYAAGSVRKNEALSWEVWGHRVNEYLHYMDVLFSPSLFILGGGVSKKFEKFEPYIDVQTKVVPAAMQNNAGIIGAACAAADILG